MYKLFIVALSASKKSAIVSITKDFGLVTSTIATGLMTVNAKTKVGDSMELPLTTKISTIEKTTKADADGVVSTFTWVVID